MKKIIAFILMSLCVFALVSCGSNFLDAQEGWDLYCEEGASSLNIDIGVYKSTLQRNLVLNYVYLNQTNTVYYKGSYGNYKNPNRQESTTFYFMYLVDSHYVTDTDDSKKMYTYAYDLVMSGDKGYTGTFDFKSSSTSNGEYKVTFYNGDTLLYTANVKEGDTAVYNGNIPIKQSVIEGCIITEYSFWGWSDDLNDIYEDKEVYAVFNSDNKFSTEYDSISRKQDVINFLKNNGKTYSTAFDYNGSFVSSKMIRYEMSNVYFGYIESYDLFVIADGKIPVSVMFNYQNFNSTVFGFGLNYGKYADLSSAFVSGHELVSCSPSGFNSYLSNAIYIVNKFLGDRGYGYLTD